MIKLFGLLVVALSMSIGCKSSRDNSLGEVKSVAVDNPDSGSVFDGRIAKCALKSEGSDAKVYSKGNLGLFEAGRIPQGTKFWFVEKFTGANKQQGEFWKIKFSEEGSNGIVYIRSSELACKNEEKGCWGPRSNGPDLGHWTSTSSSDSSPVNVRRTDFEGRIITDAQGVVAKLDNGIDVTIVATHNMNAQAGFAGVEIDAYIKTKGKNGEDLFGSNFGNCR